jgi:transposase
MQTTKTSSYLFRKRIERFTSRKKIRQSVRTAQGWYDRDQEDPQDVIQRKQAKDPVGRPPKLHEEHREFLVELIDKQPGLVLDQIMDDLTSQFMGLEVPTLLYSIS